MKFICQHYIENKIGRFDSINLIISQLGSRFQEVSMAGQDQDNSNQNDITENYEIEPTEHSDDEIDIEDVEELNLLDSKLEELNSALDYLEQKNDDIQQSLKELLQSNIEMRKEMQKQKEQNNQSECTHNENTESAGNN